MNITIRENLYISRRAVYICGNRNGRPMLFPCQGKCHKVTKGCGQRRTRPYVAQSANHGEAVHIIAKGVYHQCKALYIITQSVDFFRPYTVAVYLYGS